MSNTDFLGRAIETVKKAIAEDNAGEYEKALPSYFSALELFMLALKYEKNPKAKEVIRCYTTDYMCRAEKLKAHLVDKDRKKEHSAGRSEGKKEKTEHEAETENMRMGLAGVILANKPDVKWKDVAGLDSAKGTLQEAVILPIKFAHLFTGRRHPWKAILLYGPPGTGKSHLAKAVATEANSTFFNVSSSDLISKWMGESEKHVKQLFQMARENKPAVIFIDEIEALCGSRGSDGEQESSRRLKNELLVQMDGIGSDSKDILLLGATNIPWDLDSAILRRFQKRIHIALPDRNARFELFRLGVGDTPCTLSQNDYKTLAELSEGYSGSDISNAVQDALMEPIRKISDATHFRKVLVEGLEKLEPCSPGERDAIEMTWLTIEPEQLHEPQLSFKDFQKAVKSIRPTVKPDDLRRHQEWTKQFGSEGA